MPDHKKEYHRSSGIDEGMVRAKKGLPRMAIGATHSLEYRLKGGFYQTLALVAKKRENALIFLESHHDIVARAYDPRTMDGRMIQVLPFPVYLDKEGEIIVGIRMEKTQFKEALYQGTIESLLAGGRFVTTETAERIRKGKAGFLDETVEAREKYWKEVMRENYQTGWGAIRPKI